MPTYNEVRELLGDACRTMQDDLNVYDFVPDSLVPPAAVIQAGVPTIDYRQATSSRLAEWNFVVLLIVGQVSKQAAQNRIGELISPDSPLVNALNEAQFENGSGWVQVTQGSASEVRVGTTMYGCARLAVLVKA